VPSAYLNGRLALDHEEALYARCFATILDKLAMDRKEVSIWWTENLINERCGMRRTNF